MRTLVSTGGVPYILGVYFFYFFIFCAGGDISKTAKMLRLACSAVKKLFVGVSLTRFPVSGCGRITLFHRKAPKLWELLLLTPPHTRNIWEKGQLCSRRSGRAPPSSLQPGPFSNLPNPIFSYLSFFF